MAKIWPSPIFKKNFFRPKMPEICRKSASLQIFIGLFPNISLFFHRKTLLTTMPEICRNNRFFGIFSKFHPQFFLFFAQRCVLGMLKTWSSPIFEKIFFPAENTGKTDFQHFLEISSFVFPDFFIGNAQNFFPAESVGNMPEIVVSADFLWTCE